MRIIAFLLTWLSVAAIAQTALPPGTYTVPQGTTLTVPSTTPTCTTPAPPANQTNTCTPPLTGSWTQGRTVTAAAYPTCWTVGAWTPTSAPAGSCSAPPTATSWVYYNGKFSWGGDWSAGATANYADTTGKPLSGATDIAMTLTSSYGMWIPYAPIGVAGLPSFDASAYTKLTFALKPTVAGQKWSLYAVQAPAGETFTQGCVINDISTYGTAVVGQWTTYTVPLSVLCVGNGLAVGTTLRKLGLQDQSGSVGNKWDIDNVGFTP